MPKVVLTQSIHPDAEAFLRARVDLIAIDLSDKAAFFAALQDADGLLTSGAKVDAALLSAAPKLWVVSDISAGYNNLDIAALRERGVVATHTPVVVNDPVADLVIGLALAVGRRIAELDRKTRAGNWKPGDVEVNFGLPLSGKTLGIVGMGSIGETLARKAALAFHMPILYHNRRERTDLDPALGARYASLETLAAEADYIAVLAPLTEETTGLISADILRRMKPTAVFINAGRGPVVDEAALADALSRGAIYGAGLDVYEREPLPGDSPLLGLENVVLTPHIGTAMTAARRDMAMAAAECMADGLSGKTPKYIVQELRPS